MKRLIQQLIAITAYLAIGARAMGSPAVIKVDAPTASAISAAISVDNVQPIPEPACIGLIALGTFALVSRRWSRAR